MSSFHTNLDSYHSGFHAEAMVSMRCAGCVSLQSPAQHACSFFATKRRANLRLATK